MNPPVGSKIKVESERGLTQIVLPHESGGAMRYGVAVFLLAWLGGWAFGWVAVASSLLKGNDKGGGGFLVFWLIGWTVGGAFAITMLYRLLRPSIPEVLLLDRPGLRLDTGMPPFTVSFDYRSRTETWKRVFKKRERVEFLPVEISSLSLREFDSGNRVTIDKASKRYDLGQGLSEPEREWLYGALCEEYGIEQGAARNSRRAGHSTL